MAFHRDKPAATGEIENKPVVLAACFSRMPKRGDEQIDKTKAGPAETVRPEALSAKADASDLVPEAAERLLFGLLLVGSGLLLLALLAAFYVAAAIVLPVALAFMLMLVLRPALRISERWYVPRIVAALVLIVLLFAVAAGLASLVAAPAADWVKNLPAVLPRLQQRLRFLGEPIGVVQKVFSQAQHLGGPAEATPVVTVEGNSVPTHLLAFVGTFLGGLLETVVILFFLLVAGHVFAPAGGDPPRLQKQAASGRDFPTDRKRHLRLSHDHYADECRCRHPFGPRGLALSAW